MHSRHKKKKFIACTWGLQQIPLLMLIGSTALAFTEFYILSATAQPALNPRNPTSTAQPTKINVPTQAPAKQKSIIESLLSLLQRKPFLGGSRSGGDFCGMTPAVLGASNVIWSDHPLFLWEGKVQTLELRPYAFDVAYKNQSILWSIIPTDQQASYPNEPLQAGQRYEWQITYLSPQTNEPIQWQRTFQVMEKANRDRIAQDLTFLKNQLKAQNATLEEAALARASYFAEKDLWSDTLQQIYALDNPFSAGSDFLQAATDRICRAVPSNLVDSGKNTERIN